MWGSVKNIWLNIKLPIIKNFELLRYNKFKSFNYTLLKYINLEIILLFFLFIGI